MSDDEAQRSNRQAVRVSVVEFEDGHVGD